MTSPVRQQMQWYVDAMDRAGRGDVDPADIRAHWANPFDNSDEEEISWWKSEAARNQGLSVVSVDETSPHAAVFVIDEGRGRSHRVTIEVEPEPPHRFTVWRWRRNHPFELEIREAGPASAADTEALALISWEAAIVVGDVSTRTRHAPGTYFEQTRLIADVKVLIADIDGLPAGFAWAIRHPALVKGEERDLNYFLHLRVLPEHQRKGLWGELNGAVYNAYPDVEYKYGTFTPENVAWSHVAEQRGSSHPGAWRHYVHRFQLASEAAPSAGRPATPADAAAIVEILNAEHENEHLYVPYTVESFSQRLDRAPDLYGWSNVWLHGGAVVGSWSPGRFTEVEVTQADGITTFRRAHVLDYGCLPGADDDLQALVAARRAALVSDELTHLSLLCPEASLHLGWLRNAASHSDRFAMVMNPHGQSPDDIAERGLYFDHLYF